MKKKVTIKKMFKKISSKKIFLLVASFFLFAVVLTTFLKTYGEFVSTLNRENSGINGTTVYVNDAEKDWYYYTSMNYANNPNNSDIPTAVDKNIYNRNNLVEINITYNGTDPVSNLTGKVSTTENQDKFVYYKVLPVNNNGTSGNTSDDYVLVELIDNPFALRPNDYGFNGWITTYRGVSIYLDTVYYVRYAKVPVTYTSGVPNSIDITFYAKWLNSKRARMSTSSTMSTVYQNLDSDGFYLMGSQTDVYEDCNNLVLYTRGSVSGNWWWGASYPSGAVNAQGQSLSGQTCYSSTCYYYLRHNGACSNGTTYYKLVNNNMQAYTPQLIETITDPGVPANSNIAGYYKEVNISRNASVTDVYNSDGSYVSSTTCTSSGGCTYYRLQGYYNASNEENLSDGTRTLYYKATRDTNIIFFDTSRTSVGTVAKPATFTGIYEGTLHTNTLTISSSGSAVSAAADMRIEYIRIDSGATRTTTDQVVTGNNPRRFIFANFHNLKIGRGITQNGSNVNAHSITGAANSTSTQGSASSPKRFRLIVESGLYNFASCSMGSFNSSGTRPTIYQVGELIVGSDYDRVRTNGNNTLEVYENLNGTFGGYYNEASTHEPLFNITVKSGQIGASHDDYSTGIYVGGRGYSSDTIGGTMKLKLEGGSIYNIIGGPLVTSSYENRNVVDVSMTGGTVEAIFGGAGDAATYGNRIIKVTGGKVNYSVLGGSNGYQSEEGAGKVNGATYVYVGGTATIGDMTHVSDPNDKFYGFEAGSVFGIGNGKTGSSTVGSCDSSNVIINDHATINKNVYGGGNWGATGVVATENTNTTNIVVAGGEVKGSVYGAGNNNGSGSDTKTSTITINILGGTIDNNVYGGSKALGRVYGNVNVNVDGGTITNVYGGGEGGFDSDEAYGTFVSGNVTVKIGDTSKSTSPTITKVYGGSAFGTVNGSANSTSVSSTHTKVTVNKGNVLDVFGGGEGNDTYTPRVLGNAETIINGGTVTNVYGANDAKGKPNGTLKVTINGGNVENVFGGGNLADITNSEVRLKGGTVGSAFGGGNEAAATNTYVYLEGSSCTSIYGGSNVTGNVTTSHITATSGSSTNVYGGNNQGGVTSTSNITVSGASITNLFGGGNLATTGTTHVTLSSGTVNNVYGGGNQAGITTSTEVLQNGVTNQVIFGGSNVSGNVPVSNITINGGTSTDVYGGNNQGGVTTTANITGTTGTVGNMYGGGNLATTGNTVISITGTNVSTLFGGGNRAGVNDDTSVTISGGTVSTVFGGSNMSGVVPVSHVTLSGGTASTVFGGNNQGGSTTTTNVTTMGSSITQVFGGGNEADSTTTNVKIAVTNGTITNVFGGGNKSSVTTSNVELRNGVNVTNVYGGSNMSGVVTTSHVNMPYTSPSPTVANIYGGNNQGGKTSSAHINISGGTIQNVYGGGNYAVTDNASTSISGGEVLYHVYGGGNQAAVNYNTTLSLNNTSI